MGMVETLSGPRQLPNATTLGLVPELTRSAGIQFDGRVSCGGARSDSVVDTGYCPPAGHSMAKPSGDYIPPGGLGNLDRLG
jgi:hypothetical protein